MKHIQIFDTVAAYKAANLSHPNVSLVTEDGKCRYTALLTISEDDLPTGDDGYIDFGAAGKWATCNLGATTPCEYGDYYMWGSTTPNNTDPCSDISQANALFTDGNIPAVLDQAHDAAYVATNGAAHMPTKAQIEALIAATNQTVCTCTVLGDDHVSHAVKGMLYTSIDDETKKIFFPFAGYRIDGSIYSTGYFSYVWSASLDTSNTDIAYSLYSDIYGSSIIDNNDRYYGFSVRSVKD